MFAGRCLLPRIWSIKQLSVREKNKALGLTHKKGILLYTVLIMVYTRRLCGFCAGLEAAVHEIEGCSVFFGCEDRLVGAFVLNTLTHLADVGAPGGTGEDASPG